jgi:hypothetical protein
MVLMSSTFRARPIEIQAVQYTGDNNAEIDALVGDDRWGWADPPSGQAAALRPTESWSRWLEAKPGDWIVRESDGRLALHDAEDFARRYEAST